MTNQVELGKVIELADTYRIGWEAKTHDELVSIILKRAKCLTLTDALRKNALIPDTKHPPRSVIPFNDSGNRKA